MASNLAVILVVVKCFLMAHHSFRTMARLPWTHAVGAIWWPVVMMAPQ